MWISGAMTAEIEEVARIFYVDREMTRSWNEHRRDGEPRLMTGWTWEARRPHKGYRNGIKTQTAAYIDAWYALVAKVEPPQVTRRPPLKVIAVRKAA